MSLALMGQTLIYFRELVSALLNVKWKAPKEKVKISKWTVL